MNPPFATSVLTRSEPVFGVTADAVARRLSLSGDLDLAGVHTFAAVASLLTTARRDDIVLDLHDLRFVDAAGLGAIVALRIALALDGHELRLERPTPRVARVFGLAGLSELLA